MQTESSTPAVLYRNGRIYSASDPTATALLSRDGEVEWIGADVDAPAADQTVDLGGALMTPAFVDAHVHSTDTGVVLLGLDLAGTRSAAEVLDRLAAHAADMPADAVIVGHGWDESTWPARTPPSAAQLDRAAGGRSVYLSQASVHSAAVSTPLLARVPPDTAGYDGSGWLRRDAHHVARGIAMGTISDAHRDMAQRTALGKAASLGIAAVCECGGPGTSSEHDFGNVLALGRDPSLPDVYGYWGELGGVEKARELGAIGAGGDLYADGALGAQTAHLRSPYLDAREACGADGCGHGYLSAEQVGKHLIECTQAGMQGGFHAIGDAAIAAVIAGFALAAGTLGVDRVREARHRVEHAEILDRALIAGFVEYGVIASVQPAFDRLWGGAGQMYEQRLGLKRALASNPIGALAGVGVTLAFGSDSPVTPLDPWGTVRAAMNHHNPVHRVSAKTAFAAHTRGGWRAVRRRRGIGVLAPGADATFAVWDVPAGLAGGLPALVASTPGEPDPALPTCLRTVAHGREIFNAETSNVEEP